MLYKMLALPSAPCPGYIRFLHTNAKGMRCKTPLRDGFVGWSSKLKGDVTEWRLYGGDDSCKGKWRFG